MGDDKKPEGTLHPDGSWTSADGAYMLGPPVFFGAPIGRCPDCNGLIGSAVGACDNPWCRPHGMDVLPPAEPVKYPMIRFSPIISWLHWGAKTYDCRCTMCGKRWRPPRWDKDPAFPGDSVEEIADAHKCSTIRALLHALGLA